MSTPHPRDRALDALLRRQMPQASVETKACADPETLAAWADGGLDAQAMAQTELHVSGCGRCQAMLAAIVRSEPEAPAAEPWWSRVHLRWLVPLSAAAAAAVLWVVVGPGARPDAPVAQPETTEARLERRDRADAPEPVAQQPMGAVTVEQKKPAAAPPAAAPSRAAQSAAPAAPAEGSRAEAPADRQALAKEQPPAQTAASNEAARLPEKLDQAIAPPPPPAPAAARVAPAAGMAASALVDQAADSAARIFSRDATVRWRFADGGVVERSEDAGATWQRISAGLTGRFTSGFAPSATVCWLAGPGGAVAVTSDARTWRQVSSPAADADLSSVEASDARTATVRDTQGRTFRTTDGGATWSAVP